MQTALDAPLERYLMGLRPAGVVPESFQLLTRDEHVQGGYDADAGTVLVEADDLWIQRRALRCLSARVAGGVSAPEAGAVSPVQEPEEHVSGTTTPDCDADGTAKLLPR